MDIKNLQVLQISIEDLKIMIAEIVDEKLEKGNEVVQLKPEPNELLTRDETIALLKVSKTTLHNWNNKKTLPAQKIGGRVYYRRSIIMAKLNQVV
jgi:hypothetical protein